MERLLINGGRKLDGEVQISGAKNAVLPILAASLLTNGCCVIKNVPKLDDVYVMLSVLEELSVCVSWQRAAFGLFQSGASCSKPGNFG